MKILVFALISGLFLSSCGFNKQAKLAEAFEKCKYEVTSADSIYVAGRNVSKLITNKNFNISDMPDFALAYLRQDIPFKARLNLKIVNPTKTEAGINQFEYRVLVKGQELANGFVNQKVSVLAGDSTTVPVSINANIFQILSNGKTVQQIMEFMKGGNTAGTEKKGMITLKIKPTIDIGGKLVNYPGYITVDKEISSKILF